MNWYRWQNDMNLGERGRIMREAREEGVVEVGEGEGEVGLVVEGLVVEEGETATLVALFSGTH